MCIRDRYLELVARPSHRPRVRLTTEFSEDTEKKIDESQSLRTLRPLRLISSSVAGISAIKPGLSASLFYASLKGSQERLFLVRGKRNRGAVELGVRRQRVRNEPGDAAFAEHGKAEPTTPLFPCPQNYPSSMQKRCRRPTLASSLRTLPPHSKFNSPPVSLPTHEKEPFLAAF